METLFYITKIMTSDINIWTFMFVAVLGQLFHISKKIGEMDKKKFKSYVSNPSNIFKTIAATGMACLTIYGMAETGQITITTAVLLGYGADSLSMKKDKT